MLIIIIAAPYARGSGVVIPSAHASRTPSRSTHHDGRSRPRYKLLRHEAAVDAAKRLFTEES